MRLKKCLEFRLQSGGHFVPDLLCCSLSKNPIAYKFIASTAIAGDRWFISVGQCSSYIEQNEDFQ